MSAHTARRGRAHAALLIGGAGALGARALLARVLLAKFRRDVRALNEGDPGPVLANYAHDAVLQFNDGAHRWAGEHRGRPAIAAFMQSFIAAGLQGELAELAFAGPPWRMLLLARFDDRALDRDGEEIYRNRTVLLMRTRWGRVVRQEDFYEDTARIDALEARLLAQERDSGLAEGFQPPPR